MDEMGDLRGRVHVTKQDLERLQTRKMKGLKAGVVAVDEDGESEESRRKKKKSD